MQLVIGTRNGDTYQISVDDQTQQALHNLGIGDTFSGDLIGLNGYELEITGGSDADGFPLSEQFNGTGRRHVILKTGTGIRSPDRQGERVKRQVRGRIISQDTAQVNAKVVETGDTPIPDLLENGEEDTTEDVEGDDASE